MTPKVRIILSDSLDPWLNLATEEWIFQEIGDCDHILFLWRNRETVVIGRSQNPWAECHLQKMQQDNVYLARRQSGGGAVFHDLGNTNFTFLSKKMLYQRDTNFNIILCALNQLGIIATMSGRNDIVVDQVRKISGSAFKEKVDRAFHHGTLLLQADLNKLQNYLNPNKKKLAAKGVKSAKARVANLCEFQPTISHEKLCEAIIAEFIATHNVTDPQIEYLQASQLEKLPNLSYYYQRMQDWDWLYGQTLEFTHQFDERLSWATVNVQLLVNHGIIQDVRVYSDSLFPELIDSLARRLKGSVYTTDSLIQALVPVYTEFPQLTTEVTEFQQWLIREIN